MNINKLYSALFLLSTTQAQDVPVSSPNQGLVVEQNQALPQNHVPLRLTLSILKGVKLQSLVKKYPQFTKEDLHQIIRNKKNAGEITKAEYDHIIHPRKYTRVLPGIYKSRKYTHKQLRAIGRLSREKQETLLYILNKMSYDQMQATNPTKTRQSFASTVSFLKKSAFVKAQDTRYLSPKRIASEDMQSADFINSAIDTILEEESEPTFDMLAEATGYTPGSLRVMVSKYCQSGLLDHDKIAEFDKRTRLSRDFQNRVNTLIDLVRNKAPLEQLLSTMGTETKLKLNRQFQRLYEEQRLTPEDTAYIKEVGSVVQRRGQTKQQILSFVTQCYQANRYFGMLSSVWDAFNDEGNNGARAIKVGTLGTHYRELVKLGRVSAQIQTYMDTIKERGEAIWKSNMGNSSNLH